jgi:phage tail-like protein
MATLRNRPPVLQYAQFNFLIDFGTGPADGPHAGFQECRVQKITGLNKSADVTLKRGVISSSTLQDWLDQIRKGDRKARRKLTIVQQDEDHKIVQTWKLLRARIIKHVSGPFNAKGTDVAMEELVIAYERLEWD